MLIGNDLVDRGVRAARGKSGDDRFVQRVFTDAEAAWIRAGSDPDLALWMLWAGKEAAYKVAKKRRPEVPFAMRRYEVSVDAAPQPARDPDASHSDGPRDSDVGSRGDSRREERETYSGEGRDVDADRYTGQARLRDLPGLDGERLRLAWRTTPEYVHCVATDGPVFDDPASTAELWIRVARADDVETDGHHGRLSDRELESARSSESRAARVVAKTLAEDAGLGAVEIVRSAMPDGRHGPPCLHAPGSSEPLALCDLSLSHDGEWVAAALVRRLQGA